MEQPTMNRATRTALLRLGAFGLLGLTVCMCATCLIATPVLAGTDSAAQHNAHIGIGAIQTNLPLFAPHLPSTPPTDD